MNIQVNFDCARIPESNHDEWDQSSAYPIIPEDNPLVLSGQAWHNTRQSGSGLKGAGRGGRRSNPFGQTLPDMKKPTL
jgi:hypothetical protein